MFHKYLVGFTVLACLVGVPAHGIHAADASVVVGQKAVEPVRVDPREIEAQVGAAAYVVMDRTTGKILTLKNENRVWPIASTTKLMTAEIVLSKGVSPKKTFSVLNEDDVGGAKLYIKNGDKFTIEDLFYSMLVGSANNAANALARSSGLSRTEFIAAMNAKAASYGLRSTTFVDPSGIDPANVSTPLELAQMANHAFQNASIKKYSAQPVRNVRVVNTGAVKQIQNTNWMLTKPTYQNGIVIAGKTGYLDESEWNFVTALRPKTNAPKQELLIVVLGAKSRAGSFEDVKTLSDWAWNVYDWNKKL